MTSKKCVIFLTFSVNVAKNIGENSIPVDRQHPSIKKIQENKITHSILDCKPIGRVLSESRLINLVQRKLLVMTVFQPKFLHLLNLLFYKQSHF